VKHGPLLFLGVLSAVLASWVCAVMAPQLQIGRQELIPIDELGINYPLDRSGEAKQGAEVYRAQGCNYCHSQQVRQDPFLSNLRLADAGTNAVAVRAAVAKVRPDLDDTTADGSGRPLPEPLLASVSPLLADQAMRLLTNAGAKVELALANVGPDIRRGWGTRRTVSRDYLRDQPVMLGQVRFGPDLANVGARQTNATVLLRKLYNARIDLPGSTMPRYPYLFDERRLRPGDAPSPGALAFPPGLAPAGIEVVPTSEAWQLVAYLQSLRSDTLFYEVFSPQTKQTSAPSPAGTNLTAPGVTQPPGAANTNATSQP
jgi:cbb3-type cytochrome oxidase cytochrome c subunit